MGGWLFVASPAPDKVGGGGGKVEGVHTGLSVPAVTADAVAAEYARVLAVV